MDGFRFKIASRSCFRIYRVVPEEAMEIGLGVILGAVGVLVLGVEFVVSSASRDEGIAECGR